MKKNIFTIYFAFFLSIGFLPMSASAASIYFETSKKTVSVGDTFIITAKIDAEKTSINSVEGDIVLSSKENNFTINDFSLAQSTFTLWPRTPSLSKDGGTISFVGGVPGGFTTNKATLFNIVVEAQKEGVITISPKNMAVFANDGKGSRAPVTLTPLTVTIVPKNDGIASDNEWTALVASDKTNPEKFTIAVGREASLFDGKRFAFFNAIDNQSGISYYEVSENRATPIRSGSMYVLQNQDEKSTPDLVVTAYDKAGNKTVSVYKKPGITIFGFSLSFIIGIVVLVIVSLFIKRMRKNKKNDQLQ
jgi:hypothetical protein